MLNTVTTICTMTAVLLAVGCYRGTEYATHIQPDIPADIAGSAQAAVADWEANVPVKLHLDIAACNIVHSPATICIHSVQSIPPIPWEPGHLTGYTIVTEILLATPDLLKEPADARQRVIAHELGHAMGLQHDVAGTLMYPYSDLGSKTVTAQDAKQWHKLHDK